VTTWPTSTSQPQATHAAEAGEAVAVEAVAAEAAEAAEAEEAAEMTPLCAGSVEDAVTKPPSAAPKKRCRGLRTSWSRMY